jgi:hypothetical protein
MSKVCSACQKPNPNVNKHCGSCGNPLAANASQVFRQIDNRGGSVVAPQGNYGQVNITTNQLNDSYHRPPLDLAPTLSPRKVLSLTSRIKMGYGILSVAATFCTLFGTSFFDFFKYIPFVGAFVGEYHWWLLVYALVFAGLGLKVLWDSFVLKTNGRNVGGIAMSVLQKDGTVLDTANRCVCPISHCGGIMRPQKKLVDSNPV